MSTQPPDEPTRIDPAGPAMARPRTSKLTIALAAATGFLVGVLLVAALGGTPTTTLTQTQRVTVKTPPVDPNATVVTSTLVPPLVGEHLDTARDRLAEAKFTDEITDGGGLFGPIDDGNWVVTSQDPPAGTQLRQGSTVRITIERG
jgi:hypothetical protein